MSTKQRKRYAVKVGILTWFNAANYGAKAHSYGLQKKIIDMGHECELINYCPKKMFILNYKMNMGREYSCGNILNSIKGFFRCVKLSNNNKKLILSHKVKSAEEIDNLGYDLIILGSDEIFNVGHPLYEAIYFGVGIKTPCITYAPSSGQYSELSKLDEKVCDSLKRMKYISARDIHTQTLIENNTAKKPELVLDPTFLWEYNERGNEKFSGKYMLVYSFSEWSEYSKDIRSYAESRGWKIISVGRKIRWADKSYQVAGLDEWISAFRGAQYVFTDSFHGTVFSLKYRKQFAVVGRHDKTNKIGDLLKTLSVNRQIYNKNEDMTEYLDEKIDYNIVTKYIHDEIEKSENFLNKGFAEVIS